MSLGKKCNCILKVAKFTNYIVCVLYFTGINHNVIWANIKNTIQIIIYKYDSILTNKCYYALPEEIKCVKHGNKLYDSCFCYILNISYIICYNLL